MINQLKKGIAIALTSLLCLNAFSEAPDLRIQLSLNGKWSFTPEGQKQTTIQVPEFWDAINNFKEVNHAVYERKVTIPNSQEWINKAIRVDFEGINFIADVYVNNKWVTQHVGGFVPFSVDISKWAKPGQTISLKIDVKGGCYLPIADTSGSPLWPIGFFGQKQRWGIIFDVWLRAYGRVSIENTYIQTLYRQKRIELTYSLKNNSNQSYTFKILSSISPTLNSKDTIIQLKSEDIILQSGETKSLTISKQWISPHFWNPDDPFLYNLSSVILSSDNSDIIDKETRRFAFREIWIEGNQYMFNGHPFTIMGTNFVQHSEFHDSQRYLYFTPETWNNTIDRLFELNLRTIRFHMQPAPQWALDIADERGLMIINESGIYAREYVLKTNKALYLENCKKWIQPWIIANRNHPSIILWSAENEMGRGWLNWMTDSEIKSLGDEIRKYDSSRPVIYEGDGDVGDKTINYHYPETYENAVSGSIYSWANKVNPDKPTGVGEFITHYGLHGIENQWWQGTWVRGMRYVGFADIRPYRHDWAWLANENNPRIENLKNGFAPVALFDKEYDDLGIAPFLFSIYPTLKRGDTVHRTLILYNNEFIDTTINIDVIIKTTNLQEISLTYGAINSYSNTIAAGGNLTVNVPLGKHVEIPYSFQVPYNTGMFVDIVLIARKKGELKFKETKRFRIDEKISTPIFTANKVWFY
jgi:beta-galactosidase/beta-glucuronidase